MAPPNFETLDTAILQNTTGGGVCDIAPTACAVLETGIGYANEGLDYAAHHVVTLVQPLSLGQGAFQLGAGIGSKLRNGGINMYNRMADALGS